MNRALGEVDGVILIIIIIIIKICPYRAKGSYVTKICSKAEGPRVSKLGGQMYTPKSVFK